MKNILISLSIGLLVAMSGQAFASLETGVTNEDSVQEKIPSEGLDKEKTPAEEASTKEGSIKEARLYCHKQGWFDRQPSGCWSQ